MAGDQERSAYLVRLARARRATGTRIGAYGLMSSHVHLCARGAPLGSFVQRVNTGFGLWWNRTHDAYGPVFAERPRSIVVATEEQLARLIAYIHNNPVRAGLVDCPMASAWTSHRAFIDPTRCPMFLDAEWALAEMGFSSSKSGRLAFHDFVSSRKYMPRDPLVAGPGESSVELVIALTHATANAWGISIAQLARPTRESAKTVRRELIATAIELFGCQGKHVAQALGLSSATVSKLYAKSRGMNSQQIVNWYLDEKASEKDVFWKQVG